MAVFCRAALLCLVLIGAAGAPSVALYADTATTTVTSFVSECSDGTDNDGDGLIDFPPDPGCESATDDDEADTVFECSDGTDNDGDGEIDFPDDPGCDSASDDDETDTPSGGGGGGGGGGGRRAPHNPSIEFSGLAHSQGSVYALEDGVLAETVAADADARFSLSRDDVTPGEYLFTFYGIDAQGRRSGLLSFAVSVPDVEVVLVEDVFIPPTLVAGSFGPESVLLQGATVPFSTVIFALFDRGVPVGERETTALGDGSFEGRVSFSSDRLVVKAKSVVSGLESPFGTATRVGDDGLRTVDVNGDGRVNLVDFSIVAYWYKRGSPPAQFDLNSDGVVDLTDVSILVFYWTG